MLFKIHLKPWLHFTFQCGRGQEQLKPDIKTQHFFLPSAAHFLPLKQKILTGWSKTKQQLGNFSQCESKNALRGGIYGSNGENGWLKLIFIFLVFFQPQRPKDTGTGSKTDWSELIASTTKDLAWTRTKRRSQGRKTPPLPACAVP